jgi:hypothetical protein
MMTGFRQKVVTELGVIPFEHQANWWAHADGQILMPYGNVPGLPSTTVRLDDGTTAIRNLIPRPHGRAKVVAELAAYKAGKSYGAALWATGFAAIPHGRTYLVGIEYDMCAPEFDYLLEFLISDRGLKLPYISLQNRPKDGRLWLELENGSRFEARSWERSESLKGKEVDCYIFCEAYQLPDLDCFMRIKQNLRARQGYAIFPTTPDSPWICTLHDNGHENPDYPDWACCCGVPASVNPYTYDAKTEVIDRSLMTKEKYNIAYLGQIGTYVGRVFAYQRGQRILGLSTHPNLWYDTTKAATADNLNLPENWTIMVGVDTGTYMAAVIMAFDELGNTFVLDELTNYRYVHSMIELDSDMSLAQFMAELKRRCAIWRAPLAGWCDSNSQFKAELWTNHKFTLLGNTSGKEKRTESAREYFQHDKVWFAPWLKMLPFEVENAQWPDEATSAGRYERVKHNDHLLDGFEHLCSRRPKGNRPAPPKPSADRWRRPAARPFSDPHLGAQ